MIVVKFGGTSLDTEEKRSKVIQLISEYAKKDKVICVVSAIGRMPQPYATDSLLELVQEEYVSKQEKDRLLSCGEIISSVVMSNHFLKSGLKSISLSPYDILLSFVEERLTISREKIDQLFDKYDIVIIPGFIALQEMNLVTLPRGGSNITAAFLASVFRANKLVFVSDISGIYTQDPKQNCEAQKVIELTYEYLEHLALERPRFFPPLAAKYIKDSQISIEFRSLNECDSSSYIR